MKSAPFLIGLVLLALPSCDRARALVERTKEAAPEAGTPAKPAQDASAEAQPAVRPMTDDWRPSGVERR